jgi:hypothetical protein
MAGLPRRNTYHCAPWDVTAAVMWVAFRDHTTFVYVDSALLPSPVVPVSQIHVQTVHEHQYSACTR